MFIRTYCKCVNETRSPVVKEEAEEATTEPIVRLHYVPSTELARAKVTSGEANGKRFLYDDVKQMVPLGHASGRELASR